MLRGRITLNRRSRLAFLTVGSVGALLLSTAASANHTQVGVAHVQKASSKTITLRLGHSAPLGNDESNAATLFAQLVQINTQGRVHVIVYPNSLLGAETDMLTKIQSGALDMGIISSAVTENADPTLSVFDLPYLISNYLQANKVFTGKPAQIANASLLKAGLKGLGFEYIGFRVANCAGAPVSAPNYFKGIKIRVPNSPVFIKTFQAFGANPDPIAYNEVYTALQTGVVNCWETVFQSILNSKFYEIAKQVTVTRHMFGALVMMINNKKFQSLPKDIQAGIVKAANQANAFARNATRKTEGTDEGALVKLGVQIHQINTTPLQATAKTLWMPIAQSVHAVDLLKAIQAVPAK
jgi:tripartite ATP-independent transporter DctP family solute receptor